MNTGATGPGGDPEVAAEDEPAPGELRMARELWPWLAASAVGLLPFTVFSTFLVPIADAAGSSIAATGGLRGLGGLAAVVVGVAIAPLLDRVPKERAAAGALVVLGISSALGASGGLLLLAAFCLLVGAATAVLNPALTAAAADRFDSRRAAGRAATLVTATQSMAAMLAAPLVALPALLWGWEGDLLAVTVVSALLAVLLLTGRTGGSAVENAGPARRIGYLASFKALAAMPGVLPLLVLSLLRTAVFMGYLAYLAAYYDDRFELGPGLFAFVWTLSGASFFVSNLCTGRITNSSRAVVATERLLALGLATVMVSVVGFYFTHWLPLALVLTSLHAASHAVVAACVISLLVRRGGAQRGSALSVNAAGMSLGVFVGAAFGGFGLAVAGYPGVAATFGVLVLVALGVAVPVVRAGRARGSGAGVGTGTAGP